jgi:hypothetical protein
MVSTVLSTILELPFITDYNLYIWIMERVKKNWGKQALSYYAANDWNSRMDLRMIHQNF